MKKIIFLCLSVASHCLFGQSETASVTVTWATTMADTLLTVTIKTPSEEVVYIKKGVTFQQMVSKPQDAESLDDSASLPAKKAGHSGKAALKDAGIGSLVSSSYSEEVSQSFTVEITSMTAMNTIMRAVNAQYLANQEERGFVLNHPLIQSMLPDSALYYVNADSGRKSCTIEMLYFYGAPLKDWKTAFQLSVTSSDVRAILGVVGCRRTDKNQNMYDYRFQMVSARQSHIIEMAHQAYTYQCVLP